MTRADSSYVFVPAQNETMCPCLCVRRCWLNTGSRPVAPQASSQHFVDAPDKALLMCLFCLLLVWQQLLCEERDIWLRRVTFLRRFGITTAIKTGTLQWEGAGADLKYRSTACPYPVCALEQGWGGSHLCRFPWPRGLRWRTQ